MGEASGRKSDRCARFIEEQKLHTPIDEQRMIRINVLVHIEYVILAFRLPDVSMQKVKVTYPSSARTLLCHFLPICLTALPASPPSPLVHHPIAR